MASTGLANNLTVSAFPPGMTLDNSDGAVFIGMLVAAILFGITCVQTYTYFTTTEIVDRKLIGLLCFMDGLHLSFVGHLMYYFLISNYGNPAAPMPWTGTAFQIVSNLSDILTRTLYIDRIWRLSRARTPMAIFLVANLIVFSFGIVMAIQIHKIGSFQKLEGITWSLYCSFTMIASLETSISVALCIVLWRLRTGFSTRTDSQLHKLMVYSIQTGGITSVIAIVILVTYSCMPNNFVYLAFYVTLPSMYLNSLLATLNGRETLRAESYPQTIRSSVLCGILNAISHRPSVIIPSQSPEPIYMGKNSSDIPTHPQSGITAF
ncbi:hypothetical protein C8Q75DRAFT_807381 [Abortiporus biennis]|nr:hypothetical protein C8Q75DRAFT_807381 [Abortiporus biennis]